MMLTMLINADGAGPDADEAHACDKEMTKIIVMTTILLVTCSLSDRSCG